MRSFSHAPLLCNMDPMCTLIQIHVIFMLFVATFGNKRDSLPDYSALAPMPAFCNTVLEPPAFVYLITSNKLVFAADIIPEKSVAILAFLSPLPDELPCPCCVWSMLGMSQQEFFGAYKQSSYSPPLQPSETQDASRRMKQIFETHLWSLAESIYRPLHSKPSGVDYFILIDLEASARSGPSLRAQLTLFQQRLVQLLPLVAVPFHPCNIVDHNAGNDAVITNVFDTRFVAVHASASTLLLPLDDALFSLICHIMLRGMVMQFHVGNPESHDTTTCHVADIVNQHAMMHFVSSLLAEEFLLALPFSPRIQKPRSPPSFTLSSNGSFSANFTNVSCPVICSFYYWSTHPAFICCTSANKDHAYPRSSVAYNADVAYAKVAERWQLPRSGDLDCAPLTVENYAVKVAKANKADLTHPLPKFALSLSAPPVSLNEQCACVPESSSLHNSTGSPSKFSLSLQPSLLQLQASGRSGTSALQTQFHFVFSAPSYASHSCSSAPFCQFSAIFGSIETMHIRSQCNGTQHEAAVDTHLMNIFFSTDHSHQSAKAPWFYLPSENGKLRWFELTSNTSKDALRILTADVSVSTSCDNFMFVSANATVLIREVTPEGFPCSCHVISADSLNVSFSAAEEARRASVLFEGPPPVDLFYDGDGMLTDSKNSDFTCAGANRDWPWQQAKLTELPRDGSAGLHNMCLFQNICWIDGQLTLFLPASFWDLDQAIPSFFAFQTSLEDKLSASLLGLNLSPYSFQDSRRSLWYETLLRPPGASVAHAALGCFCDCNVGVFWYCGECFAGSRKLFSATCPRMCGLQTMSHISSHCNGYIRKILATTSLNKWLPFTTLWSLLTFYPKAGDKYISKT
jgi:hypothetical protein